MDEELEGETFQWSGTCDECDYVLPPLSESKSAYFQKEEIDCPNCGFSNDLWRRIIDSMDSIGLDHWSLRGLGARQSLFSIEIGPGEVISLDLTEHCDDLQEDAAVLSVDATPIGSEGAIFPVRWSGNTLAPLPSIDPTYFPVAGVPQGDVENQMTVTFSVSWASGRRGDISWSHLVDAQAAFAAGRYEDMVVPAHVSVELKTMRWVSNELARLAPRNHVKDWVEGAGGVSYHRALTVLIPYLAKSRNLPVLPDDVQDALLALKKARNDFVHEGLDREQISRDGAIQMLCGAVFGFEYIEFLEEESMDASG